MFVTLAEPQDRTARAPNETNSDEKIARRPSPPASPPIEKFAAENQTANPGVPRHNQSTTDWWSRASTILITLFTGALAWLAHRQHQAIKEQAEYMRDGLALTKQAAEAATVSANAAKQSSEIAGASLEAIREQTTVAKLAAESAADNAVAAKTMAQTMINTERAWLLLSVKTNIVGVPHRVHIQFRNSGRSPAFLTEVRFDFLSSPMAILGTSTIKFYPDFPLPVIKLFRQVKRPLLSVKESTEPGIYRTTTRAESRMG